MFEHESATAISRTMDGCIESGLLIGGLDRNIIEGAPAAHESYIVSPWAALTGAPAKTSIGWSRPHHDAGYGWLIASDAFVVSRDKMHASLRMMLDVRVFNGISIEETTAAIDINFSRLSHTDALAVASGTITTPDKTFSIDSTFAADISSVRALESKD